jgi:cytochrome b561
VLLPHSDKVRLNGDDMRTGPIARYSGVSQLLHWATAILVFYAFSNGPGGSEARVYAPFRDSQRQLHETLGVAVLALVAVRLLWRMVETRPDLPQVARWMHVAAKTVQSTLYVLLFAVPFTAIAGAWLEGHPLTLLAGFTIPPFLGVSHDAGEAMARLHTWLGDAILWIAVFHGLAALYHHFVLKDAALVTMLPRWLYRDGRRARSTP